MALTTAQAQRCLSHLRYPLVTMGANAGMYWATLQQQLFPLYAAINHLEDGAETLVVQFLDALDATETQMLAAQARMKVAAVGDILLNQQEIAKLKESYRYWQSRLSGILGVPVNPAAVESSGCIIRRVS